MSTAEPSAAPPDTPRQRVDRIVNGLLVMGLVVFGLGVLVQLIFSTSSVGQYSPFPGLALLVLTFPYALGNGTIRGTWIQRLCGAGVGFLFVGLIGHFAVGFEYWSMRWLLFVGTLLLVWGLATGFISGAFPVGGQELDQWRRPVKLDSLRNSDRWPIHRVMTNYEKLRRKPLLFRMFTGLSADEFD
ncbi:MAG: hypothetical protein FJ304_22375, partial [Planctomycetes bacterium]|nr:hypothetical protein [Planctomycetota bacterium]